MALLVVLVLGVAGIASQALTRGAGSPSTAGASPLAVLRTSDFHALAFAPADPDVAFFGHHDGVMRTQDGGRTWKPMVEQRGFDAMGMAASRADARVLYVAGHDVLQSSADGGATWQPVRHNLPGTDIHSFAMSPDDPDRLYAFVNGGGLFGSLNGGQIWQQLGQMPPDVMALSAAGGSSRDLETLYAASMGSGVLRSDDGGLTWRPAANGLDSRRVLALAVDPAARQTIYAGADGGLYKSTDGGGAWTKLPFPGRNAVAVAVSPARPTRVLAVYQDTQGRKGEVFRSDDAGQTWTSS